MSATAQTSTLESAHTVEAVIFEGMSGCLHLGRCDPPGATATGVVICSPLGRDARCAHLPMRLLAEDLAAAGYPTLRYDHLGTGDSSDLADDVDALPIWLDSVALAVAHLRAETGVRRVVLCGVRLGASLAAMSAGGVDGLMLLAPVVSGRSWLRKLRFSAAIRSGAAEDDATPLDVDGLQMSGATAQSLCRLDLLQLGDLPSQVLLVSQGRINDAYSLHIAQSGAALTQQAFTGYDDLFLDAHSNQPPTKVFEHAVGWMRQAFPGEGPASTRAAQRLTVNSPALVMKDATERPVRFGAGLHGVLCTPTMATAQGRGVLFCNTGGDPRAGIGRFAAQAARILAQNGIASLRFDFAGVGDSPMSAGRVRSHVYETSREADLQAAVNFLQAQDLDRIDLVGVCAGAYHALHAAMSDRRISGVFAISPAKLVWRTGDPLTAGRIDQGPATRLYMRRLRQLQTWSRFAAGQVDVGAASRNLSSRLARRMARTFDGRAAALRNRMHALSARGGRACFLMGLDDASLDEVETYFGPKGARLAAIPGMSVRINPRLDHGLARSASRALALEALRDWLG